MTASGQWQPNQGTLQEICHLLWSAQQGVGQPQIHSQLQQLRSHGDYLAYIFAYGESLSVEVRQTAGLYLKTMIRRRDVQLEESQLEYIKTSVLPLLASQQRALRQTAGTLVSSLVSRLGTLTSWEGLVLGIRQAVEQGQEPAVEGALDCMLKITEEALGLLADPVAGSDGQVEVGDVWLPGAIRCLGHPSEQPRLLALKALYNCTYFTNNMPRGLAFHLDTYCQGLFDCARQPSADIQREVCRSLSSLIQREPEILFNDIEPVVSYILDSCRSQAREVAMEAVDFWASYCAATQEKRYLVAVLPTLLPILLNHMVFDDADEEAQEILSADAAPPPDAPISRGMEQEYDREWNLRKVAASTLDGMAVYLAGELLPALLPLVQAQLQDPNWRNKEAGTLALGAVWPGCYSGGLREQVGPMKALIAGNLQDANPTIRVISTWVLGRVLQSLMMEDETDNAELQGLVRECMTVLLGTMGDRNWKVQASAASAVASMLEHVRVNSDSPHSPGGVAIHQQSQAILESTMQAFRLYGRNNRRLLYDILCQLTYATGSSHVAAFWPTLMQHVEATPWHDLHLGVIMETVAEMAEAGAQEQVRQGMGVLVTKALECIVQQLQVARLERQGQRSGHSFEELVLAAALDLLGPLSRVGMDELLPMLLSSQLPQALLACAEQPETVVRQSAFALTGDLATRGYPVLEPHVQAFVQALLTEIQAFNPDELMFPATNNAIWALGQVMRSVPTATLQLVAEPVLAALERVLAHDRGSALASNAAAAVGWLATGDVASVNPARGFFPDWCAALRQMTDDREKEAAFGGLAQVMIRYPRECCAEFIRVAAAVASWRVIRDEGLKNGLHAGMQAVLKEVEADAQLAGEVKAFFDGEGQVLFGKLRDMGMMNTWSPAGGA